MHLQDGKIGLRGGEGGRVVVSQGQPGGQRHAAAQGGGGVPETQVQSQGSSLREAGHHDTLVGDVVAGHFLLDEGSHARSGLGEPGSIFGRRAVQTEDVTPS